MSDPSSQPTQPLTDAELSALRDYIERTNHADNLRGDARRLLEEVDRLRAENTAQAELLAAVRAIEPRQRTGLTTPTLLAEVSGWNGAVATMRAALGLDQDGRGQTDE